MEDIVGELKSTDGYNTFFNPATRRLVQVTLEGAEEAIQLVDKTDATARRDLMIKLGVVNPLSASLDSGEDFNDDTDD